MQKLKVDFSALMGSFTRVWALQSNESDAYKLKRGIISIAPHTALPYTSNSNNNKNSNNNIIKL